MHRAPTMLFYTVLYAASFAGSLVIASLSYQFIEQPLLRLKNRFSMQVTDSQQPPAPTRELSEGVATRTP